ncbi:hypothetical protein B0H11DRAFT_2289037 [Mycena galericulata]|nr:hypothetical protein B0H11DRAFT_2289037 [Mycena galericulata]
MSRQDERDTPPHLGGPVLSTTSIHLGPDTTTGATGPFLSTRTTASIGDAGPTEIDSASSGEHTVPLSAPTGLRVKVRIDENGQHYVYQTDTGIRFDISDDEEVPTETPYYAPPVATYRHPNASRSRGATPDRTAERATQSTLSTASDMLLTSSHTLSPAAVRASSLPAEVILDTLSNELRVHLSPTQKDQYSLVRGMLTTGRSALLTTTAFVAGQRATLTENVDAIENIRVEMAKRLADLHHRVTSQEVQLDEALEENVRVLRAFGSTEDQLAHLTRAMANYSSRSSPKPELPPLSRSDSRATTPLTEFQKEMDAELTPRGPTESADAYYRRGAGEVARKERTATSFGPTLDGTPLYAAPSASAVHFAKSTRFDDVGSISTARTRPYQAYTGSGIGPSGGNVSAASIAQDTVVPAASHYETFHQDQEKVIRQIAHREIGEVLNLPPHIRAVKTDPPPKYRGDDDLDVFMKFVELHCTWLRSQMLCGYDPSVDKYRLSILKGHLEGAALEWFMQTINSPHFQSERELSFTDALCALHQRFVTSANAQRATRAFDAVRFDNQKGPDNFAESLLKRAHAMHHIPDEFIINQKFQAGLPQNIRYKLKVDREMTAEYTPFMSLRNSARQLWAAMNEDTPPAAANPRASAPTTMRSVPTLPTPRRAIPNPETHTPQRAPLPPRIPGSEDTRTCFKCGGVGHIGTNPRCPRYNEPSIVPGARVGAQRVLESYADGNDVPDDEYAVEGQGEAEIEDFEGLWGGQQYEEDPNAAPELETLLQTAEDEEPVRVGAIHAQYFATRIPEPDNDDVLSESSETDPIAPISGIPAVLDLDQLQLQLPGNEYPEWDAAEEACLNQIDAAANPSSLNFAELLTDFDARTGSSLLSATLNLELESINALGAEDSARDVWRRLIHLQPALQIGYSAQDLRTTAVDVEGLALRFNHRIFETRQYQQDLLDLLARRLDARIGVDRLSAALTSSDTRANVNVDRARDDNYRLCADIERHVHHVERILALMLESQGMVNEELTRRLLAREAFALEASPAAPPSPTLRTIVYTTVVEDRDGEASAGASTVDASTISPEPADDSLSSSTPPPSYPGMPETGGSVASSDNLWETLSDHGEAINSVSFLPGDAAPAGISGSEEENTPGLRASRLLTTSTGPQQGPATTDEELDDSRGELVEETYEADTPPGSPSPPTTPTDSDRDPIPGEPPRMISRAIYLFGAISAEYVTTFLRSDGTVFLEYSPLPDSHYLNEHFRLEHAAAMNLAITEHALDLGVSRDEVRRLVMSPRNVGERYRPGFLDTDPPMLPGDNFHERLASLGPEDDDEDAYLGFRVQVLARTVPASSPVEHLATVRRTEPAKLVGLLDQPKRVRSNMACLSALLQIGTSQAYVLFDSGSNTDSLTPEYAHATDLPRIRLAEQITLQLGCKGSRSKISYGTRAAIDFGGVKGHLYFDQVNLDRYDGVIGTPFMNRHGLVLDFGRREICFPNGKVIRALSAPEEASVLTQRHEHLRSPIPETDSAET